MNVTWVLPELYIQWGHGEHYPHRRRSDANAVTGWSRCVRRFSRRTCKRRTRRSRRILSGWNCENVRWSNVVIAKLLASLKSTYHAYNHHFLRTRRKIFQSPRTESNRDGVFIRVWTRVLSHRLYWWLCGRTAHCRLACHHHHHCQSFRNHRRRHRVLITSRWGMTRMSIKPFRSKHTLSVR